MLCSSTTTRLLTVISGGCRGPPPCPSLLHDCCTSEYCCHSSIQSQLHPDWASNGKLLMAFSLKMWLLQQAASSLPNSEARKATCVRRNPKCQALSMFCISGAKTVTVPNDKVFIHSEMLEFLLLLHHTQSIITRQTNSYFLAANNKSFIADKHQQEPKVNEH